MRTVVEVRLWMLMRVVRRLPVRSRELTKNRIVINYFTRYRWEYKVGISLPLVYFYAAFLQTSYYQPLVVLKVDLSVSIEVGHRHPAVDILLGRVVVHTHHGIGLVDQVRDLILTEEPASIFIELLKQSFCHLQPFSNIFGVSSTLNHLYFLSALARYLTARA